MKAFILTCALIVASSAIDMDGIIDLEDTINQYRSTVFPLAKRMTCLIWSRSLQDAAEKTVSSCKLPDANDGSYAVDVSKGEKKYMGVFAAWLGQNANYQFDKETCIAGKSCHDFKTAFNDLANHFACSQAKCDSVGSTYPQADQTYTYTVCKFDEQRQKGKPYNRSDSSEFSCSATSCPGNKNLCMNNLCCLSLGNGNCEDKLDTCTKELCQQMPGRYLKQCKKTCDNCDECKCEDSDFKISGFHCEEAIAREKTYCNREEAKEYCPKTCNKCEVESYCVRKGRRGNN